MHRSPLEPVLALDGERVRVVPAARLVVAADSDGSPNGPHVAEQKIGPAARVEIARGAEPPAAHAQVEDGMWTRSRFRRQHGGEAPLVALAPQPCAQARSARVRLQAAGVAQPIVHEVRVELLEAVHALQEFPDVRFTDAEILVVRLPRPLPGGHRGAQAKPHPGKREDGGDFLLPEGILLVESAHQMRQSPHGIPLGEHRIGSRDCRFRSQPGTHGVAEVDDAGDAPVSVAPARWHIPDPIGEHVVVVGVAVHHLGAQARDQEREPLLAVRHPAAQQRPPVLSLHAPHPLLEKGGRSTQVPVEARLGRGMLEVGEGGVQAGQDASPGTQELRTLRAHLGDRHAGQPGDQAERVVDACLFDGRKRGALDVGYDPRKKYALVVAQTRLKGGEPSQDRVLHFQRPLGLGGVADLEDESSPVGSLPIGRRPQPVLRLTPPARAQEKVPVPLARKFRGAGFNAVAPAGQHDSVTRREFGTVHVGNAGFWFVRGRFTHGCPTTARSSYVVIV